VTDPRGQAAAPREQGRLKAAEAVGSIIGSTSLLTGLFFYFGWAQTNGEARVLGIDSSVLDFSTRDYLLRSVRPTFWPLVLVVLTILVAAYAYRTASDLLARGVHRRLLWSAAALGGSVAVAAMVVGVYGMEVHPLFGHGSTSIPVSYAIAILTASYAVYLVHGLRQPDTGATRSSSAIYVIGAAVLLLFSLFWATGSYADYRGTVRGRNLPVASLPNAVVFSARRLDITGACERKIGGRDAAYRFRYEGLKLLIRTGGRYILLPAGWRPAAAPTVVLDEGAGVRFEFAAAGGGGDAVPCGQ
jgi:hypothetical protein